VYDEEACSICEGLELSCAKVMWTVVRWVVEHVLQIIMDGPTAWKVDGCVIIMGYSQQELTKDDFTRGRGWSFSRQSHNTRCQCN